MFFFASAGVSPAYLTVSEIFPMETRALCIALFYAAGTGLGGIIGPQLFGPMVATVRLAVELDLTATEEQQPAPLVDLDSGRSIQYLVSQENWMTVVRQVLRMPDYDELLERDGRQSRPSLRNARGRRRETGPLSPWRCEREHQWRQRLRASRTDSWSAPARAESSVSNARSPACVRTRNLVVHPGKAAPPATW